MAERYKQARMKRFGCALLGYTLAALLIPNLWPKVATPFAPLAGLIGGSCLIFPMWYGLHYRGLVQLKAGEVAVDMGLAVGMGILVRDSLIHGVSKLTASVQPLFYLLLGALLAAYVVSRLDLIWASGRTKHHDG